MICLVMNFTLTMSVTKAKNNRVRILLEDHHFSAKKMNKDDDYDCLFKSGIYIIKTNELNAWYLK
jgi:hypothetical protein